jgi:hypothetical protein
VQLLFLYKYIYLLKVHKCIHTKGIVMLCGQRYNYDRQRLKIIKVDNLYVL